MFHPLLENGGVWFHNRTNEITSTTLTDLSRKKCKRLIKNRLDVLCFLRQTHQSRRPWVNCNETTPRYKWQKIYNKRNGSRSFYSLGVALCSATDRSFSDLPTYCAYITAVLAFYDFYDSKKIQAIPNNSSHQNDPSMSPADTITSTTSSTSSDDTILPMSPSTSFRMSISRKFSKVSSTSSTTASPSFSFHSSSSYPPSPPPEDDTPVTFHSPNPSLNSKPDFHNLPKGKLPSAITKNPVKVNVLSSLNTLSEEELAFMPDAYQSFMTLLDVLILLYYNIDSYISDEALKFITLNEVEESLVYMEPLVKRVTTVEACNNINHSDIFSVLVCRDPEILEQSILSL